ncbi:guanylate kinase, partial [Streptococcus pyogenes]
GREYYFISEEKFNEMIENNELLEHANVHGNYYGTPIKFVEEMISKGKIVILEIDVQGAEQVRNNFENAVNVFVIPPKKS